MIPVASGLRSAPSWALMRNQECYYSQEGRKLLYTESDHWSSLVCSINADWQYYSSTDGAFSHPI